MIAAAVELLLGTYCGLACVAWCARSFLFNSEKISFSPMVLVWLVLTVVFVSMYIATWRRKKAHEAEDEQIKAIERITQPDAAAPGDPAAGDTLKQGIRG